METKATVDTDFRSRNVATVASQLPRHLPNISFHAHWTASPRTKWQFCTNTGEKSINFFLASTLFSSAELSFLLTLISFRESHDIGNSTFKRYPSPSPPSHPSQALPLFCIPSTLLSHPSLQPTTKPISRSLLA